jgi:hypothetical protein
MAVNQLRPYERHIVSNISTLLPAGLTLADLATGQIGIFDAKTNKSVTAPTYATNKVIYFAQGTPDKSGFPAGAGVPNIYRKSQPVDGKKLLALRGKKASRGQGEIVTLGYDGVDATKTLTAKPGETFYYYIRLTGDPIFNLNPDRAKGVIILGAVQMPCADDCSDNCSTVDCNTIADKILEDYNGHFDAGQQMFVGGKFLPGGQRANQYVQMCKVAKCTEDAILTTVDYYSCSLTVADDGSQSSLGLVQAQAPGFQVTRTSRDGIFSTYTTAPNTGAGCPSDFNQNAGTVIPNCDACAVGVLTPTSAQFEFKTDGELSGADLTALDTVLLGLADVTSYTLTLLQLDTNINIATYQVNITPATAVGATATAINAAIVAAGTVAPYVVGSTTSVGIASAFCTLPESTTAYTSNGVVCHRVEVQFKISLKDTICGTNYLAELQAAYATIGVDGGTVSGTVEIDSASGCVHEYTLTTFSKNCVPDNCCADDVVFPDVPAFAGTAWTPVALATGSGTCVCGIQLTSNFVTRKESECTFGNWVHQTDWAHIEISSHNPDWRSTDLCEVDPIATRIQNGAYPNGEGPMVVRLEKQDRMYEMDYFYLSPVLREAFDFYFEAKFDVYYDMIAVEYNFTYPSNDGFGQWDTDNYAQYFWLPEGQTGQLTTALNTYAASVPVFVDPIVL